MLQLPMGFGGGHCSSPWHLEVNCAAPHVSSFLCPVLVCSAGLGTKVQEKEEAEEEGEGCSLA